MQAVRRDHGRGAGRLRITLTGDADHSVRLYPNKTMRLRAGVIYDVPDQVGDAVAEHLIMTGIARPVSSSEDKPKGQQRRRGRRR